MIIDKLQYHGRILLANMADNEFYLPADIRPLRADVKITENCNAKCIICDHWKNRSEDKLDKDKIIDIFKQLASLKVRILRISGGEPLLRKDLFDILRKFTRDDFTVVLSTNGLLLNRYIDEINDSIINNIKISIDAIGDKNDYIRGVKGYYNKSLGSLKYLKKKITIGSVLNNLLIDDLEQLINYCQDRGYNYDIHLPCTNTYFHESQDVSGIMKDLWPTPQNTHKALDILEKYNILSGTLLDNAKSYLLTRKFQFNHCILGFIKIYIDSQGNVRTGCYEYKPVGNLMHSSLEEIISSHKYRNSVLNMFNFKCRGCTCGCGISATYSKPLKSIKYLIKRMKEIN